MVHIKNTQHAIEYIKKGWILKEYKSREFGHAFYVWDSAHPKQCGSALYMSSGIFKNLLKLGYKATKHELDERTK